MKFINEKIGVVFLLLIAFCFLSFNGVFAEESNGTATSDVGKLAIGSTVISDSGFFSNSMSSDLLNSNDVNINNNNITSKNTSSNDVINDFSSVKSNNLSFESSDKLIDDVDSTEYIDLNTNWNYVHGNNFSSENNELMDNVSGFSLDNHLANQIMNANNGDSIYLQSGVYDLSNININKNLTIHGLDYGNTVIDGNNNLIFTINPGSTLRLIGVQIIRGDCKGLGVIYNQGNLVICNCSFYENKGLVIYNSGLTTVNFSRFFNNDASDRSIFKNTGGTINIFCSDLANNHAKYTINNQRGNVSAHYDWWGSNNGSKGFIHGNVDANNFVIAILHIKKNQSGLLDFTCYSDVNGKICKLSYEIPDPEVSYKLANGKDLNIYDFNELNKFLSKIIIFSNDYGFLEILDGSYTFNDLINYCDLFKLFNKLDYELNSSFVCPMNNYVLNFSYGLGYYSLLIDLNYYNLNLTQNDLSINDDKISNLKEVYIDLDDIFFDYSLANDSYYNLSLVNLNSNLGFTNFSMKRSILNQLSFNKKLNTYLSGVDLTLNKGESACFTVKLKDENCEGLAGHEVNITIRNETGLSEKFMLVSGADGIVSINFNLDEGIYEVESSYLGSSQYEKVKTVNTINIVDADKMSTNLERKFFNTEHLSSKFQFKLEDSLGNGIAGQRIHVNIRNQNNDDTHYNFNTNMGGILDFGFALEPGVYELNLNFFGSSEYLPSNINQYFIVKD